jgi:hypothetical protein
MGKNKHKHKIYLKDDENYLIVHKQSTVLVFSDNGTDHANVEIMVPDETDMEGKEYSPALNLATAVALKLKNDRDFGYELLSFFNEYLNSNPNNETVN